MGSQEAQGSQCHRDGARREPDFVILKDRVVMVVEIDGGALSRRVASGCTQAPHPPRPRGCKDERVSAEECSTPVAAESHHLQPPTLLAPNFRKAVAELPTARCRRSALHEAKGGPRVAG